MNDRKKIISRINMFVVMHNLLLKQIKAGKIDERNKVWLQKYKNIIKGLKEELNENN